jgi:hypothetical protein
VRLFNANYMNSEGENGFYFSTRTGPDGKYAFPAFFADASGFTVTTYSPTGSLVTQYGDFSQSQQVTIDFILPFSVVKGQLRYADGSAADWVNNGSVFALGSDGHSLRFARRRRGPLRGVRRGARQRHRHGPGRGFRCDRDGRHIALQHRRRGDG